MKPGSISLSRFWAALSVLLIGSAAALWMVRGNMNVWSGAWQQVFGAASLFPMRATMGLLLVGMLFSWSSARLLATLLKACGPVMMNLGFWLGKAAVFFPMSALAWSFLGLWIGQLGHPIWTLMPVARSAENLPTLDLVAHFVWTWAPALGLLSVPLTGQCLSRLLRLPPCTDQPAEDQDNQLRSLATPHLDSAQREAGRQPAPSLIRWRAGILLSHPAREVRAGPVLPVAAVGHAGLWGMGMLAYLLLVCLEDTLGIQGAAAALGQSLRAHDFTAAAPAMLMMTCLATLWTLVVGGPGPWPVKSARHGLTALFKFAAWSVLALTLATSIIGLRLPLLMVIDADMAFASPKSALLAGLPPMLCALSLWFVGHIIRPPNVL